jgi:hypothetical protein
MDMTLTATRTSTTDLLERLVSFLIVSYDAREGRRPANEGPFAEGFDPPHTAVLLV